MKVSATVSIARQHFCQREHPAFAMVYLSAGENSAWCPKLVWLADVCAEAVAT